MCDKFAKKIFFVLFFVFYSFPAFADNVISILYYENTTNNPQYEWFRKGLADMLITDIAKSSEIQVVERESIENILKEQKLSLAGFTDPKNAVEVGKLLNVNKLVYGSFIITGDLLRIDTKVTEVQTGKILHTLETTGKIISLFDIEKDLAEKLFLKLSLKIPDTLEIKETDSLDALKNYYEGVFLLDEGDAEKAKEKFEQAIVLDPLYNKPQKGLEESYKFLKDFQKMRMQREIRELYKTVEKLKTRIKAKKWKTYADILMEFNVLSMTSEQQEKFNIENSAYMICDTKVMCVWQMMNTLQQIADKKEKYFNDVEGRKHICKQIVNIGEDSKKEFKADKNLSEVLYAQLYALYCLQDYKTLKEKAEAFMLEYPDYRLIEQVESMYDALLQNNTGIDYND